MSGHSGQAKAAARRAAVGEVLGSTPRSPSETPTVRSAKAGRYRKHRPTILAWKGPIKAASSVYEVDEGVPDEGT